MKSRFSLFLAALAVIMTPLAAHATGPTGPAAPAPVGPFNFEVLSVKPGSVVVDGGYASPYNGAFTSNLASTFSVWCVDLNHEAILGQQYNVMETFLAGTDFSNTRLGASGANLYRWAAVLAGDMTPLHWTDAGATNTAAKDATIQDAMWTMLGEEGGLAIGSSAYVTKMNTFAGTVGLSANFWLTTLDATNNAWALLTCTPVATCGQQEFLVEVPSTPQEVTPEPATMSLLATGLVGMMGAGKLRRRRRNA